MAARRRSVRIFLLPSIDRPRLFSSAFRVLGFIFFTSLALSSPPEVRRSRGGRLRSLWLVLWLAGGPVGWRHREYL